MCDKSFAAWVFVVASGLPSAAAWATCPTVPNGTFDSNGAGWSNYAIYDSFDGQPAGSLQVGPVGAGSCGDALSDCLPIAAGDDCLLTAEGFVHTAAPTDGWSYLDLFYYSDPGCSDFLSLSSSAALSSVTQGFWTAMTTGDSVAPATAQSMKIGYNVCSGSAPLTSNVDNIVLLPALIFEDGFESANTNQWSSTVSP